MPDVSRQVARPAGCQPAWRADHSAAAIFAGPGACLWHGITAGAVTVTVPGGPCDIDASTRAGARHVNVASNPPAPGRLALTSDAGGVVALNPA